MAPITSRNETVVPGWHDQQFRQSQHHARENINAHLLVDGTRRALPISKDPITAVQPGQETMPIPLFAAVAILQQEAAGFVEESEFREVHGVLPCGFEDCPYFFAEGSGFEEEDHDEGMREADFGAVDEAIAQGFEEDEGLVVGGVEDDFALEVGLGGVLLGCAGNDQGSE